MSYCESCGRKNEDGTRFCESCGQPMTNPAPGAVHSGPAPVASVPSHSPAPAASLHADSTGTNFIEAMQCPMCGASVKPRERECYYCHATLIVISQGTFVTGAAATLLTKSLEKWRAILKQDPNNGEAHYAVGIALLNLGLFDRATEHLTKAEAALPEHAVVHYNLALAIFGEGDDFLKVQGPAVSQMETAYRLDPGFVEADGFLKAFLGIQLLQANAPADRVVEKLEAAVAACSTIPIFYAVLALAYAMQGHASLAVRPLRQAGELDPTNAMYPGNLSALFSDEDKYDEALELARQAEALIKPSDRAELKSTIYTTYGRALFGLSAREKDPAAKKKLLGEAKQYAELGISICRDGHSLQLLEDIKKSEETDTKCFVATATMGCDGHPDVLTLREWRDKVLSRSKPGQVFIKIYYKVGPWLAKPLEHSAFLRLLSRHMLIKHIATAVRRASN